MTSNALNSKRQYLPKAKVCKPVPPAPPPGWTPPSATCSVEPLVEHVDWPESALFQVAACCPDCPPEEFVALDIDPDGGTIGATLDPKNCDADGDFIFDGDPGTYHISVTFIFSNGARCTKTVTCHVHD